MEYLNEYYTTHNEDARLLSRRGSVEFLTSISYIEKYLREGMRIIEIGAGSGRYSHYFARKGFSVDAVELIEHNIELFNQNTQPGEKVTVTQGNATDLSCFPDGTYDITLLLGPMYHLYSLDDKLAALREAKRVTRPGGVLFVAYCMNEATIIQFAFQKGNIHNEEYKNLIDPVTFKCGSDPRKIFELYRREDIDELISNLGGVRRLHFVGTDMYTKYFKQMIDEMDNKTFELYLKYHFAICERPDMTGISNHTLDILRVE